MTSVPPVPPDPPVVVRQIPPALARYPRLTRRALLALDAEIAALVRCLDRRDGRAAHERALQCQSMLGALVALHADQPTTTRCDPPAMP